MARPPELQLPRPPRWSPWALATSVALHLAMVVALMLLFVPFRRTGEGHLLSPFSPEARPRSREVLIVIPPTTPPAPASTGTAPRPPTRGEVSAPMVEAPLPVDGAGAPGDSAPGGSPAPPVRVTPWPSLGSGVLWDRRTPAPAAIARTHAELTDSAVKAILNHYLDSLAARPGGGQLLPPSWKATIGGREYGLDGRFITVAGVKIPSLILALIPLPNAGNESKALDVGGRMRVEDYRLAMPRQAAAADRQEQIREIRARAEAERELNREQQEP